MSKRYIKLISIWVGVLLVVNCSTEVIPVDPQAAILTAPSNNETCLDGISINDTQSNVELLWSAAQDALSYEVVITNLMTQTSQTYASSVNALTVSLIKAEPYLWSVKSIGEEGSNPATSDEWRFYLAGDAITNYAPFPSVLLIPRSGANVTLDINSLVILNWTCSDVDDDLVTFEVYLDEVDATTKINELEYQESEVAYEVEVESGKVYYWKIIAIDSNGNQSSSGVYAFRTN